MPLKLLKSIPKPLQFPHLHLKALEVRAELAAAWVDYPQVGECVLQGQRVAVNLDVVLVAEARLHLGNAFALVQRLFLDHLLRQLRSRDGQGLGQELEALCGLPYARVAYFCLV